MKVGVIRKIALPVLMLAQIQLISSYVTDLFPWHFVLALMIVIICLLLVLGTRIYDYFNTTKITTKWPFSLFVFFTIGTIYGSFLAVKQDEDRKENSNIIIEALNSYKKHNGQYPLTTLELKPQYLESIPTSNWGIQFVPFDYVPDSSKHQFGLEYKVTSGCSYFYHSSMTEWQLWD